jgi:ferritin
VSIVSGPKELKAASKAVSANGPGRKRRVELYVRRLLAVEEKDHAGHQFLEWFVNEQVEEEDAALTIVDQLKLVGDNGVAIYMIDQELGQRQPTAAGNAGAA